MGVLKGKTAMVTGSSQGLGAAISRLLIENGCNICMHYFRSSDEPERLKKMAEEKGVKALCIKADLNQETEAIRLVREATAYFGKFHVLVNNSGSLVERRWISQIDMEYWRKVIDINITTMMLVTRELLPNMDNSQGASIVNVSSLAGRKGGHPGSLVYAMTKGAMLTWTRALSTELASKGIRVNAVAPGFIEGTLFHQTFTTKESAVKTIEGIPLGRSGNPDDVARAVVFLASEYDGFITGETIDINGGVYCA
jgi:3-oxoacyl-[acyl-carrier protein] reductase